MELMLSALACTLQVLILIIMEDTHGGVDVEAQRRRDLRVLILIIMEDTHGEQ